MYAWSNYLISGLFDVGICSEPTSLAPVCKAQVLIEPYRASSSQLLSILERCDRADCLLQPTSVSFVCKGVGRSFCVERMEDKYEGMDESTLKAMVSRGLASRLAEGP